MFVKLSSLRPQSLHLSMCMYDVLTGFVIKYTKEIFGANQQTILLKAACTRENKTM